MKRIVLTLLPLLIAGCAVGPNYKRPAIASPPQFRGSAEATPVSPANTNLADTKWFDLFKDEQLTALVNQSLAQNYDLRIAASRVLEARAQFGITRSNLYPNLNGSAGFVASRAPLLFSFPGIPAGASNQLSYTTAGFSLGWELDVWGRIRRLTEAARAQYFATEEARRGVITTLVSDVSSSYLSLRESDLELEIARKTRDIAQRSLDLTVVRRKGGVATSLDVHQAEQFLYTATSTIAAVERRIEQTENLLSLLAARNPGPIARGKALTDLAAPPEVPAGLPSALLNRRPDIRAAEQNLIAANANIGAARAEYFPQITLTGLLGVESKGLTRLFDSGSRNFNIAPQATIPIFNAGRLRNQVRFTEAQQQEALASYEKSIQTAFREVSDALVGYRRTVEERAQQELLVKALRDANRLATVRYRGGLDSYLQVLDSERNLFTGELNLAQLRRDELVSVVVLYRTLGGGW